MCEGEGEAHFNIGTDDLLGSGGCCELAKMVNRYWDVHTYTNRGEISYREGCLAGKIHSIDVCAMQ